LRGYFLNLSYTPLERPKELGNKALYTPEEALAAFKKAVEEDAEVDPRTVHYDWKEYGMDAWQSPVRPNLHTALIVDPPDGRIPPMTPEGRRRQAAAGRGTDVLSRGLYERCVTGNQGPPRLPGNHDAESQIQQTPGYVILIMQSNSDVGSFRPTVAHTCRRPSGNGWAIQSATGKAIRSSSTPPTSFPSGSGAGLPAICI
jgi:hypothetical protein